MSPDSTTPTIVLVHGAFAESAGWADVIAALREHGYSAIAVANPLRGLEADAAYLRSVIDGIDGPVVVVGHSYGGAVMSIAADGADRVKALVYIASFNLEVGESAGELAAKFPGGQLGTVLDPKPFPLADGGTGTDLYIQREKFHGAFAADVAPEVAELMAVTQRPIAASALEDTAAKAAWKTIPSWTLVSTQDLAIPPQSMRFMAGRAGSTTVEVDASHAVYVSQPRVVADLIVDAARATTGAGLATAAA
jgi:pimeloyl-ACP methyl ester carboxylesterase